MNDQSLRHATRNRRYANRRGATLLDVAAGSMLLAVILIPSAHLLGQSRSCNARLTHRQTMLFEAENRLEATKIALSDLAAFDLAWAKPSDLQSPVVVANGPELNSRTRVFADATIPLPAKLLTIEIDVWRDANRDHHWDSDEPGEMIRTQWASP